MKVTLLLLGFVAFSVAVSVENPCECPHALHRVCGSDGQTYSNPCTLNCAKYEMNPHLVKVHDGPCKGDDDDYENLCDCDDTVELVCGTDGQTYTNLCKLECATLSTSPGVEKEHDGPCEEVLKEEVNVLEKCPRVYSPVCGTDGRTYPNLCVLERHTSVVPGLKLAHLGKC